MRSPLAFNLHLVLSFVGATVPLLSPLVFPDFAPTQACEASTTMDSFNPAPMAHPTDEMEVATTQQMRNPSVVSEKPHVQERIWGYLARTDPTVTFEEYTYWAKIEREMEVEEEKEYRANNGGSTVRNWISAQFSKEGRRQLKEDKAHRAMQIQSVVEGKKIDEKNPGTTTETSSQDAPGYNELHVTDAEWRTAARAMRTASWGQMFFLITTDILGWSGKSFFRLRMKSDRMVHLDHVLRLGFHLHNGEFRER